MDRPEAAVIRESLSYLIVDDECDCGCESFGVRDARSPEQDYHLQSWVDARSADGETTLGLLLGSEGRLKYLDIYTPDETVPDSVARSPNWAPGLAGRNMQGVSPQLRTSPALQP